MSGSDQGKKALVTGACGFSAGYVIDLLLKKGWKVKATDLKTANRTGLERFGGEIEFIAADLTNKESLKPAVKDVDVVFHPAAVFSYSAPLEILRKVNVEGTKNLIEASINANVQKMVLWSSVAIYGSADSKWYKIPITEDQELNPNCKGRYDISKREQEAAAMEYYKENGFPITAIRPAPIYGPGSYYGIYTLMLYVKQASLPAAFRNLHKKSVPLVHVTDIAGSALFLSDIKNFNGEVYNVADDYDLDMVQTLRFIAFNTGQRMKIMLPFPTKILQPFLKLFGMWSNFEANHLRKKVNGKAPVPKLETDTISYMFGNYKFSNQKIKDAGYKFKYPDRRIGLIEVIKWYDQHGWLKPQR
ncbi:MAG: NAD-dependent epimerase/dehydratase family protein [Promethearchaeota archaeon]